jgi:glycosyltransferase involved in cell wall biosynthesis
MKIGVDARFLTHPQKGGYKTYTENLISALACVDGRNQYILYVDRLPDQDTKIPRQPNFSYKVLNQLPVIGMPWREQVGLSLQSARDGIELLHSPCLTAPLMLGCPSVITIHDMIWLFPKKYSQSKAGSLQWKLIEWYNRLIPRYASKRASAIITVSQVSKEDIATQLKIEPDLIFVTSEAANQSFQPIKEKGPGQAFRKKHGLHFRFILAIGSADPRKNLETLVRAYAMLPDFLQAAYHLVIVWTAPVLAPAISKLVTSLGLDDQVQFLNKISNEDLVLLYNEASLFVFPSLYEGFGLPLLEAMACGVPVVAANTSSIPEIAGDAARLFDAKDPQELSRTMAQVLGDEDVKTNMVKKGFQRSATFSWEKCAHETLSVYSKVLSSGRS